jgi:hypothetical protein
VPLLEEKHDFAHPVEDDRAWSESYYFNGYDPETDAGLFTRIGIRPNEGTIDVGLTLWLPGGRTATVAAVREQLDMIDDDLEVGRVRYERLEPMARWRLTCHGDAALTGPALTGPAGALAPVALDVTFHALTPAVGADGQERGSGGSAGSTTAETAGTVGKGHFEQAGRWSGWIEAEGTRWVLGPEARGNRDKSWGPRRWAGPTMWRWFSINVGDDVHFGGIRIGTPAGDLHRGWVWRDGEASSIRRWDVETDVAGDGLTHRAARVRATDKRDRVHDLRCEVLRVYGVPHRTGSQRRTVVNEGLARWEYEGRTGYGIAEYLHQLDDDGRPLVAIE